MYDYFSKINVSFSGDVGFHTALRDVGCFLAAAHTTMLSWLKMIRNDHTLDGHQILAVWHELMEKKGERRLQFFSSVVELATKVRCPFLLCCVQTNGLLCNSYGLNLDWPPGNRLP